MLYYGWKGTRIAVTAALSPQAYQDLDNVRRTRLDRRLEMSVQFWDLTVKVLGCAFLRERRTSH